MLVEELSGEFLHGLQNSLCVISSALSTIEQATYEDRLKLYTIIKKSTHELTTKVQEGLSYSHAYLQKQNEAYELFILSDHVKSILEYITIIAADHEVLLTSQIDCKVSMLGNKKRIEELIVNILSNAITHTKSASIRTIHVRVKNTLLGVVLLIQDTGCGIPKEMLPYIFNRSTSSATKSGHGLGLYIARQIVEEHGGYISITSPGDTGAFVSIRFPHIQIA
jgi:signal transduction histidine kinase